MEASQIITLLSGAGIGAVLSAILVFVNNSKRNQLDYITKERSEWRNSMKAIIVDLLDGKNRHSAISKLRTQLNPYGHRMSFKYSKEYYLRDAHIWYLIDDFDYSEKQIHKLVEYLELSIKYNWEHSKKEISYRPLNLIYNFIKYIVIILLFASLFSYTIKMGKDWQSLIMFFDLLSIALLFIQNWIIDSWNYSSVTSTKKQVSWIIISYVIPYAYFLGKLLYFFANQNFISLSELIFIFMIVIFLIIILSLIFVPQHDSIEEWYITKIKLVEFGQLKDIQMSSQLYDEISYFESKIERLKSSISEKEFKKLHERKQRVKKEFIKKRIETDIRYTEKNKEHKLKLLESITSKKENTHV
ncbi:MAG: hypothetical protein D8H99_52605 [Streptococcus sp.]|nr:MAG: hypothetical protein D8H99_52605 [Streptococcus sp.]